jgi:hypothetical protein
MDPDKLAKVLAMAESEHQGEALSALRAARIMLSRAGMSFKDLAAGARPARVVSPPPEPRAAPPDRAPPPDQLVQGLRRQVGDLEREIAHLKRALDKANGELDRQRDETGRWRVLARETAEKLWDMGKALERRHSRSTPVDRRRAVLEMLQDPGGALLSDNEIARRVGASSAAVAQYRRRLAIVGRKLSLLSVTPRGRGLLGIGPLRSRNVHEGAEGGERRRWLGYAATGLTLAGDNRRPR